MSEFNFQEWSDLYQADPVAFEAKKEAALEDLINKAPDRCKKHLQHTLFRIRMTQQRAKSPLQSALEASKLMWESFNKLREKLDGLTAATQDTAQQARALHCPATQPNTRPTLVKVTHITPNQLTEAVPTIKHHQHAKIIPFGAISKPHQP